MIADMQTNTYDQQRGITLLEVLISIGILAIGVTSVISLVPAAGSQASRAIVLDRASAFAANVLADAATFGLLAPDCVLAVTGSTPSYYLDPDSAPLPLSYLQNSDLGRLKAAGVFATAVSTTPAGEPTERLVLQSRDDIVVGPLTADDTPPNNFFDAGLVRSFDGRFTALLGVSGTTPGVPGRMSVVVFHRRDRASPLAVSGTVTDLRIDATSLDASQLAGRRLRDVVRPGAVLWAPGPVQRGFHQIIGAAIDRTDSFAYVTLSSGTALLGTHTVQLLPDSVGLAERMYVPEHENAYRR
jgi:type II secretory pathway pseudopilin PulG